MARASWCVALAVGLAGGLGCASTPPAERAPTRADVREGCLNSNHARSVTPLHERYVYVRGRSGEHFLLTLDRFCLGLTEAPGVTLVSTFPRVCSGSGAEVRYSHFGQPQSCVVLKVEVVPDKATAEQLVWERTPPRPRER